MDWSVVLGLAAPMCGFAWYLSRKLAKHDAKLDHLHEGVHELKDEVQDLRRDLDDLVLPRFSKQKAPAAKRR